MALEELSESSDSMFKEFSEQGLFQNTDGTFDYISDEKGQRDSKLLDHLNDDEENNVSDSFQIKKSTEENDQNEKQQQLSISRMKELTENKNDSNVEITNDNNDEINEDENHDALSLELLNALINNNENSFEEMKDNNETNESDKNKNLNSVLLNEFIQ